MSRPRRTTRQKENATEGPKDEKKVTKVTKRVASGVEKPKSLVNTDTICDNDIDSSLLLASIPSQSQLLQTRSLIAEKATTLSQLQALYEKNKKALEELETRIQAAKQDLFDTQAKIAPVNRVPAEILGLIFTIHVWEHDSSPWVLAHVSRIWRASALMTKGLWARILLVHSGWGGLKKHQPRILDGREVCFQEEQLARALKRAGAAPLDLRIVFSAWVRPGTWRLVDSDPEHEAFNLFNSIPKHQAVTRLCSLDIVTSGDLTPSAQQLKPFTFTDLTSLTLDGEHPSVIEKVVNEARNIQHLCVRAGSVRKLKTCQWWSNLSELTIRYFVDPEEAISVRSALSETRALKKLELEGTMEYWLNSGGDFKQLSIPSISHLKLRNVHIFWPIDCPNLTHLELQLPPEVKDLADGSIRLPHLVELKLLTSPSEGTLRVFDVPSLHTLELRSVWGKAANAGIFKNLWPLPPTSGARVKTSVSNIEPRTFWLRDTEINQKVLARTLMERTLLEEFSTWEVEITSEFFDALVPVTRQEKRTKKAQNDRGPTIHVGCPTLKRLNFDISARKLKQERAELENSAKAWMRARAEAGVPLERLAILYSKEEEWKELAESNIPL